VYALLWRTKTDASTTTDEVSPNAGKMTCCSGFERGSLQPQGLCTFSRYKVWHDDVCKELQLEIRALVATRAPDDTYLLERQRVYKRRVKHLVRKHRAAVAIQKCQQWRTDKNAFWRSYKPKGATCPFPEHFKIKMNSWDQTATSPAPTHPQHNIERKKERKKEMAHQP
jgi:hypothetical protein